MIRDTLPDDLKDYYNDLDNTFWDYDKVECLEKKIGLLGLYTRYLYKLPDAYEVLGKKDDIFIYHYSQKKIRPTIICSPILGGKMKITDSGRWKGFFPIAKMNAWFFSIFKRWNVLIVCTDNNALFADAETPEKFELSLKNIAYNNIQALQYIKTLPETDKNKIYALGVSLGAITMCCITGIDDSIKAAALVLGGGPLSPVISKSVENGVREFFERLKKNLNADDETVKEALMISIKSDPIRLGYYIPDDTAFMILSECDISVSTACQKILLEVVKPKRYFINKIPKLFQWLSWFKGKPGFLDKISKLKNGHYITAVLYPILLIMTLLFFHEKRHCK